jgi:hypothetical protein
MHYGNCCGRGGSPLLQNVYVFVRFGTYQEDRFKFQLDITLSHVSCLGGCWTCSACKNNLNQELDRASYAAASLTNNSVILRVKES